MQVKQPAEASSVHAAGLTSRSFHCRVATSRTSDWHCRRPSIRRGAWPNCRAPDRRTNPGPNTRRELLDGKGYRFLRLADKRAVKTGRIFFDLPHPVMEKRASGRNAVPQIIRSTGSRRLLRPPAVGPAGPSGRGGGSRSSVSWIGGTRGIHRPPAHQEALVARGESVVGMDLNPGAATFARRADRRPGGPGRRHAVRGRDAHGARRQAGAPHQPRLRARGRRGQPAPGHAARHPRHGQLLRGRRAWPASSASSTRARSR